MSPLVAVQNTVAELVIRTDLGVPLIEAAPEAPRQWFGWPARVPGFGPRAVGPFTPCVGCGTWVRYGDAALCWPYVDIRPSLEGGE